MSTGRLPAPERALGSLSSRDLRLFKRAVKAKRPGVVAGANLDGQAACGRLGQ